MPARAFSRWVREFFLGKPNRCARRGQPRFRPGMEHLEERVVPAIVLSGVGPQSTTEGVPVQVNGTYSDTNGNAATTFTASVGTVTKQAGAGTWEWRHNATEEVTNQSVTVTATNSFGDQETTQFDFTATDAALRSILTANIVSVNSTGAALGTVDDYAFDGDPTTNWNGGGYNKTITAQFDGTQTASGIALWVVVAPDATKTYTISISADGTNFTQVAQESRSIVQGSVNALEPILFQSPVSFEHLRIDVTEGLSWVSIQEVRLLAPTDEVTPPTATEGQSIADHRVYHFSDDNPGANVDDYTATVELGDGNTVSLTSQAGPNGRIAVNPAGEFDVLLSHTYADPLENATFRVSIVASVVVAGAAIATRRTTG